MVKRKWQTYWMCHVSHTFRGHDMLECRKYVGFSFTTFGKNLSKWNIHTHTQIEREKDRRNGDGFHLVGNVMCVWHASASLLWLISIQNFDFWHYYSVKWFQEVAFLSLSLSLSISLFLFDQSRLYTLFSLTAHIRMMGYVFMDNNSNSIYRKSKSKSTAIKIGSSLKLQESALKSGQNIQSKIAWIIFIATNFPVEWWKLILFFQDIWLYACYMEHS